jgi:hypothetical protein
MINTTGYDMNIDPYVLPSQCEKVIYSQVLGRVGCSFVVRFDIRGSLIKYIFPKEYVRGEDKYMGE